MFEIGRNYFLIHKGGAKMDCVVSRESDEGVYFKCGDICNYWSKKNIREFFLLDDEPKETPKEMPEKTRQLDVIMYNREEQQKLIERTHADLRQKEFEYAKAKLMNIVCTLRQGGYVCVDFKQKERAKEIMDFFAHPLLKIQYEEKYQRICVEYVKDEK